jgi:hypothetical protein
LTSVELDGDDNELSIGIESVLRAHGVGVRLLRLAYLNSAQGSTATQSPYRVIVRSTDLDRCVPEGSRQMHFSVSVVDVRERSRVFLQSGQFGCRDTIVKEFEQWLRRSTSSRPRSAPPAPFAPRLIDKAQVDRDWARAMSTGTLEALEGFASRHAADPRAESLSARAAAMRVDLPAWEQAQAANTLDSYKAFLERHPRSPFREQAERRIVDLEVREILRRPHGELPSPARLGPDTGRVYAILNVHNNTTYVLTVRYSGIDSFKVSFRPGEKGSIEVRSGAYQVAASVDAERVRDYAGASVLTGSNYQVEYYIVSAGSQAVDPPRTVIGGAFAAWPSKRVLPDFFKVR